MNWVQVSGENATLAFRLPLCALKACANTSRIAIKRVTFVDSRHPDCWNLDISKRMWSSVAYALSSEKSQLLWPPLPFFQTYFHLVMVVRVLSVTISVVGVER